MHALIVVAHPDPKSLSHSVAAKVAEGISEAGAGHSFEIADLTAEDFDPRFSAADFAAYHKDTAPPADVLAEQERIDRATDLVLVYPVYWWSMPAILKGWIDRVFSNGWAYDTAPEGKVVKKLRRLRVHLLGVAGTDAGTFERHGYSGAMKIQIDHGIFDYCGAPVATSENLFDSETRDPASLLKTARTIGSKLFEGGAQSEAA
jgi:NAD(P)H dehydrogenase (quinone)